MRPRPGTYESSIHGRITARYSGNAPPSFCYGRYEGQREIGYLSHVSRAQIAFGYPKSFGGVANLLIYSGRH